MHSSLAPHRPRARGRRRKTAERIRLQGAAPPPARRMRPRQAPVAAAPPVGRIACQRHHRQEMLVAMPAHRTRRPTGMTRGWPVAVGHALGRQTRSRTTNTASAHSTLSGVLLQTRRAGNIAASGVVAEQLPHSERGTAAFAARSTVKPSGNLFVGRCLGLLLGRLRRRRLRRWRLLGQGRPTFSRQPAPKLAGFQPSLPRLGVGSTDGFPVRGSVQEP
jgi:hypothetical protein